MRGVSIYKRSFNSQSVIPSLEQQELVPNRVGLATLFTDLKTRAGEGLNVTPSYLYSFSQIEASFCSEMLLLRVRLTQTF